MSEFEQRDGYLILRVNPKVYSLDVIYSAAYVLLEKAYFLLEGDPDDEIIVKIKPKDSDTVHLDFYNELVNYSEYKNNYENNKEVRQIILQRALAANDPLIFEDDYFDDPDGIAIPWEEKYGKSNDNKTKQ